MAYGQAGDLGDIAAIGKRFISRSRPDSRNRYQKYDLQGASGGRRWWVGLNELTGGAAIKPATAMGWRARDPGSAMLGGSASGVGVAQPMAWRML